MKKYQGRLGGEVNLEPIRFSEVFTKTVRKNNETSGKIQLPIELIDEEVVVLLPIKKSRKQKRSRK